MDNIKLLSIKSLVVGPLLTNCYLVSEKDSKKCLVIDPGGDEDVILKEIYGNSLEPQMIICTHTHGDHIAANQALKNEFDIELIVQESEASWLTNPNLNLSAAFGDMVKSPPADRKVKGDEVISLADIEFQLLHLPGHSPGGLGILYGKSLFCGDTLFRESVGRTDLPGGEMSILVESIKENIFVLPGDTIVYPGHGIETTVEYERQHNPFLNP